MSRPAPSPIDPNLLSTENNVMPSSFRNREFVSPPPSFAGRFWGMAQFISPFLFAIVIVLAIWGGYGPDLTSSESLFNHLIVYSTIVLAYIAIQGFAVVLQPVGSDVRPLMDVLTSLVPLLVIAFAIERAISGYLKLNYYETGVLWLSGLATLIDLTCFTLFAMKVNRLAPDVVLTK